MEEYKQETTNLLLDSVEWFRLHSEYVSLAGLLMVVVGMGMVVYWVKRRLFRAKRELPMDPKARKVHELKVVCDIICDGFEEAVYANRLSQDAANRWYRRLAEACELADLKPRKLPKKVYKAPPPPSHVLKERIKSRLNGGAETKTQTMKSILSSYRS